MLRPFKDFRPLPVIHRHLRYVVGKFAKSNENSRFDQISRNLMPSIPERYGYGALSCNGTLVVLQYATE